MAELVTLYDKEGKAHTVIEYEVPGRIAQGWSYSSTPEPREYESGDSVVDTVFEAGGSVFSWLGERIDDTLSAIASAPGEAWNQWTTDPGQALSGYYSWLAPQATDSTTFFTGATPEMWYNTQDWIDYNQPKIGGSEPRTVTQEDMDALSEQLDRTLRENYKAYSNSPLDRGNAAVQLLSDQQHVSLVYGITEDIKNGWLPDSDEELINRMMTDFNISEITAQRLIPGVMDAIISTYQQMGDDNMYGSPYGGGRRGGSGRTMPVYTPPDRRTVEEMVRNQMIALLGKVDEAGLPGIVDSYMTGHKKAAEGQSIDPNMNVLQGIRNLETYKRVHALRPDSFNEAQWVGQQQQALVSGGSRLQQASDRAIDLAAMGAAPNRRNAELSEFSEGFTTDGFFSRIRRAAQQVGEQI